MTSVRRVERTNLLGTLIAALEVSEREFETKRALAEAIANEEAAALCDDATYASWLRKKKLAEHDVRRLEAEIGQIRNEIEAERGRRERAQLRASYQACKVKGAELETRLERLRDEIWPEIRSLIIDLAKFDDERNEMNRLVPRKFTIGSPDAKMRSRPSQQEEVIRVEDVDLWCYRGTYVVYENQKIPDNHGNVSMGIKKTLQLEKRRFRKMVRAAFVPADDAVPLYLSLRMPRLDRIAGHQFDGACVSNAKDAVAKLTQERRGIPREFIEEFIPLGPDGNEIVQSCIQSPPSMHIL